MLLVSDKFHERARGQIISPKTKVQISFDKEKNDDVGYFTLDQSYLDGVDLLAPTDDNPIQLWDTYVYGDYSDRLIEYSLSRSIEFPNSAQSAILDVKLNDYDKAISYPQNENGLPKRPLRLYEGFHGADGLIQSFVGLTQDVMKSDNDRIVTVTCMDFLTEIGDQTLNQVVKMRDVTTDKVLAAIVEQFGVVHSQYDFDTGNNTIPFVYLDTQKNAGNAIKELVLAEGGSFWQDESGILRFRKRNQDRPDVSQIFSSKDIVNIDSQETSGIYNVVNINCEVRKIQPLQEIFKAETEYDADSDDYIVKSGGTYSIFLDLEDPAWSANVPTLNGPAANSNFTAADKSSGAIVNSGVTAEGVLFTDSYKITFTNTNNYPVRITMLSLWGEPAKVVDTIKYIAKDEESVEKFGEMTLDLTDNKFISNLTSARTLATEIIARRSNYNSLVTMESKYDPSLQLGDTILIESPDIHGDYVIVGSERTIGNSGVSAKYYLEFDWRVNNTWFILNESVLDGTDILG